MWMRALRLWVVLAIVMVANGTVRALPIEPAIGARAAELLSAGTGIVLILLVTRPFVRSVEWPSVARCL